MDNIIVGSAGEWNNAWKNIFDLPAEEPSGVVKRAFPDIRAKEFVDLGSGKGRNSLYLLANGGSVLSVDAAQFDWTFPASIKYDGSFRSLEGDVLTAPLEQNRYDGVLMVRLIQYIAKHDLEGLLDRVSASLRAHGTLALSYTENGGIHSQQRITDLHQHKPETVQQLIEHAGLLVTDLRPGESRSTRVNYEAPAVTWEVIAQK